MFQGLLKPLRSMFHQQQQVEVEQTPFTQDIPVLEQYFFQNVFIYNELMFGCGKFDEVMKGNCVKLGAGFTKDDNFTLWMHDAEKDSVVFSIPVGPDQKLGNTTMFGVPARILGQVFAMRPDHIKKLDEYLMNGVQFNRQRIKVLVPYSPKNGRSVSDTVMRIIPAWAYIGNLAYWSERIIPKDKRFHAVSKFNSKADKEPYYFYSAKHEQGRPR